MFPCAEEPAAAGRQAYWRNGSTVVGAGGESLDRSPAHAFAGRAAADGTGSTIAQNDGLAPAASMASEPRNRAAASIHIALAAQADIPAVVVDSLFAVELDILVVAMELGIPAAVSVDTAAALRDGLTVVPDGLVATGWALDGGEAAQSSDYDGPEREMAPLPRPALR
jgi:hypothetical protein